MSVKRVIHGALVVALCVFAAFDIAREEWLSLAADVSCVLALIGTFNGRSTSLGYFVTGAAYALVFVNFAMLPRPHETTVWLGDRQGWTALPGHQGCFKAGGNATIVCLSGNGNAQVRIVR